ncbi:MAG TPA: GNAT family N-acetyltransferase [Polyangiaceae bacterium]|nr:GNAT family N-acetyltransferase [Polyangiaceae bacterium]
MSTNELLVEPLSAADASAYNELFSRGASEHPDTLRISPADIAASPFKTAPGAEGATLVARGADGQWLGVVTVEREQGREKRRHIAWILRMYVPAAGAGRGVGRALLRAAIARARELPGVCKLNLTVAAHNARAVSLYESEGFVTFAREVDAFRDAEPRTELTMARPL